MQKKQLRDHLLKTCSEKELKCWYDPLHFTFAPEEKRVTVSFPHSFFLQWFQKNAQSIFEEQLNVFLGNGYEIRYDHAPQRGPRSNGGPHRSLTKSIDLPYGRQFTFDSFLTNKKNYFPLASAREVVRQQEVVFNPFIICGDNGSGKTHLLKAIGNELHKNFQSKNVYLGSIEDINDTYNERFSDFFKARTHFQSFDFMLVDDLQLLSRRQQLQQEIVLLFNHFYDNRKQMVFCSTEKIPSLQFMDPTLKSRLEWGLIVNLKKPDLDIRVDFIRKQCKLKKLPLSKEQILTLGQRFNDFRHLQGIMLKLFAFKELLRKEIGPKEFKNILEHSEERTHEALTADGVIATVARRFELSPEDIKGSKRRQNVVLARQTAMYLCRKLLGASYPALGRIFGGKDHSTVLYSVKKIEELQQDDQEINDLLKELADQCRQQDA
ncbi:MAG: chromosomal replication initiator protein [Desulfovibrionales bacterium]|nr:chromosomal replication initiator protein [Desulfovibrionales bacterium]